KIDGYSELVQLLLKNFEVEQGPSDQSAPTNFIEFPYDWRLSNRESAKRLKKVIDDRLKAWRERRAKGAKVILMAHSMGGLISRYYLEVLEGWRDCRALITF